MKNKDLKAVTRKLEFENDIFNPDLSKVAGGNFAWEEYIYISPTLQNKRFGLDQEERILKEVIDTLDKKEVDLESIYLASAYFNPPYAIWDSLSRLKAEKYEFVTATKEVSKIDVG